MFVRLSEVIVCGDEDMGLKEQELPFTCQRLDESIRTACTRAEEYLSTKWLPKVADHLVRYVDLWKHHSRYLTDCLFRAIYAVMSSQLRDFAIRNLEHFHQYFVAYNVITYILITTSIFYCLVTAQCNYTVI